MRYFKHITSSRNDPFVRELLYKFGSDGYLAWFGTIEIICESLTPKRIKPCGKLVETLCRNSPRFFSEQLLIGVPALKRIYEFIAKCRKGKFKCTPDEWIVDIPKVLAFMDEWMDRVLKETREQLPSPSGKQSSSAQLSTATDRSAKLGALRHGQGGAGAGLLALLADEFTRATGKAAFGKVRKVEQLIETMGELVKRRGLDPCVNVMRSRIDECKTRGRKLPSSLAYFVPVFQDDGAFVNGKINLPPATRTGETAALSDLTRGLLGGAPPPTMTPGGTSP